MDGLLKTWILDISDFADNFIGHSGPVTCLDIANDNSFLVSGSSDMTLKVWNMSLASVTTLYKVITSQCVDFVADIGMNWFGPPG